MVLRLLSARCNYFRTTLVGKGIFKKAESYDTNGKWIGGGMKMAGGVISTPIDFGQ